MSAAARRDLCAEASPRSVRALHVYSGNMYGGIETLLVNVARSEAPHGIRSRFALCFDGVLAQRLRESGVTVDILGDVRVRHPWSVQSARRRLDVVMASERFDVVNYHACWPLALFGSVARARQLPVVYWAHDAPSGRGKHWIERWARRHSPDLVITNSRFTDRAVATFFPDAPRATVHYPIPAPRADGAHAVRRVARAELGVSEDQVVILVASRIEPLKGHLLLAEALGRLRALPRWVAFIVGGARSPEEQSHLARILDTARAAGVGDRVRHLGHRNDVPDLLAAADIYCQPNTAPETFGISFVESLYAGLPIVTSALGGALEIVDASCGVLVPPGDCTALAAALAQLVGDGSLRARLGSAGPARARELCDVATQLDRLRVVLNRAAGSTPAERQGRRGSHA